MKHKIKLFIGSKMLLFVALTAGCLLLLGSCEKFLGEKPDIKLSTPETLDDLEALIDNYQSLNTRFSPAAEVGSDNYYLTAADWAAVSERDRNLHIWEKFDNVGGYWSSLYNNILHANVILDNLDKIKTSEKDRWNLIKGSALFIRAFNHFQLSQLFALPFDSVTAKNDLGIPLRLNSDMNIEVRRSSVLETYESILNDLKQASLLLQLSPSLKYRPSRPAAYGLLSRVYLSMRQYKNAGVYADSCLQLYDRLIDYNIIDPLAAIPFPQFNEEVLYGVTASASPALAQSRAKIDTILYNSYENEDLRKTIFFKVNSDGSHAFKGHYTGLSSAALFTGIAINEIYLTKAESCAREGDAKAACDYLNHLLVKRFKTGYFSPFDTEDSDEILRIILEERRKELLFRNLRWTDLRRLNKEARFAKTIFRQINGEKIALEPESQRYVLQIDRASIEQSGIKQNP